MGWLARDRKTEFHLLYMCRMSVEDRQLFRGQLIFYVYWLYMLCCFIIPYLRLWIQCFDSFIIKQVDFDGLQRRYHGYFNIHK